MGGITHKNKTQIKIMENESGYPKQVGIGI